MSMGIYLQAMLTVLREPPLASVRVKVAGLSRQASRNSFISRVSEANISSRVSFSALWNRRCEYSRNHLTRPRGLRV